ncbi:major facilitator superfamily domain-containing protein [Gilbertella persicaria]|uniref:major facilitator superfamily domain-containing protein n=1 Tax=Gilbertella persicaria TaxID=101096 RepID=UPI00221FAD2D|nr:major facilitator superfamily domain-containing protein [Gilbertella persicaria]KAI8092338.1 major facilitator superfamily domain-containing protein [Gilbertella persicaria]
MTITEQSPLLGKQVVKKPSPWYIIAPMFAVTFAFGALYAPLIQFYTVVFCYKYYESQANNNLEGDVPSIEDCAIPEVQAIVSKSQAIIMFLTSASCLLSASYYGSLSDRKGRRIVLLISSLGSMMTMIAYIMTIQYTHIFGISLLFIAPIIRGLFGGDNILIVTAQAYISDCTTPKSRTIAFGHLMAVVFLGPTIGPTVSSYILKTTGNITHVFIMVLLVNIIFELYVYFILPESHDFTKFNAKKKTTFLQRINVFSALNILFTTASKHANRYALVLAGGIQFFLNMLIMPPTLLYAMLKFGWTAYEGGLYISLAAFTRLLVMVLILPVVSKLFHKNKAFVDKERKSSFASTSTSSSSLAQERKNEKPKDDQPHTEQDYQHIIKFDTWMIRIGMLVEMLGFIAFGFVKTSTELVVVGSLQSFALLAGPSIRSLQVTLVSPAQVGELMGAIAVVESISSKFFLKKVKDG